MATNSFVIDPQQLEQAKAYAKAAAEENLEFYERMGKIINKMCVAVDGIESNMGDQGFNNQIANQRGNLTNLQKRFKENSQRAEKLCDMIQMGLDQGEITEQGLAGMLQSMTDFLMDALGFFHADTASKTEGQVLGATKAVAVSGAALAGTFGLVQPTAFTPLGDLLNRLLKSIQQKIREIFSKSDGVTGGQTAPDTTQPAPPAKPDLQNSKATLSRTYGAGTLWRVEAYTGSKYFDKSVWPKGYNSGSGCGVAATATAISGLGIKATPAEIHSANGNKDTMSWGTVAKENGLKVSNQSKLASASLSYEKRVDLIDSALEKYCSNPDRYAPPIIGFTKGYNGGSNHYVVVYGKNADGSYKIVDSSGNYIETYRLVQKDFEQDNNGKTFYANLNQIVQYYK